MPKKEVIYRPLIGTRIIWVNKKAVYQAQLASFSAEYSPDDWVTVPLAVFRDVLKQVQADAMTDLAIAVSTARDAIDEAVVEFKEQQDKPGMLERDN